MAKLIVVSVKDSAVGVFSRPFFVPTVGLAVRSFTDEVNRAAEDNQVYRHPDDYVLFRLGSFDEETGIFENDVQSILCQGSLVKVR